MSISIHRAARKLDRIAKLRGCHCTVDSDTGTELSTDAILTLRRNRNVEWHCFVHNKPIQKRFKEGFNGLQDECLNEALFSGLRHARHLIAARRDDQSGCVLGRSLFSERHANFSKWTHGEKVRLQHRICHPIQRQIGLSSGIFYA
ncbi:transposase [Marivita hallyeonensis]|uniref:transposase n=1 Tax=Marivita hallyeonensis TaxID=996342 RepID=UPI0011608F65|nr:transposase [Marivita hallyeonensis]